MNFWQNLWMLRCTFSLSCSFGSLRIFDSKMAYISYRYWLLHNVDKCHPVSPFTPTATSANTLRLKHTAISAKDIQHLCFVVHSQNGHFNRRNRNLYGINYNLLKRQRDKSIIKFYCLLTVCNLETVTPSQWSVWKYWGWPEKHRLIILYLLKIFLRRKSNNSKQEFTSTVSRKVFHTLKPRRENAYAFPAIMHVWTKIL